MLTNFVDKQTTVTALWLNGIDQTVNGALQGGITAGQILQALGLGGGGGSLPIQISQGGTSATDAPTALANLGGITTSQATTIVTSTVTRSYIGNLVGPPTTAEQSVTGLVVVDDAYPVNNLLRYGIIPNDPTKALQNATILQTLLNPLFTSGPTGTFWSPNNGSGAPDTYFFNFDGGTFTYKGIEIRDGCVLDLNECLWSFSATYDTTWNTRAFLHGIRDVTIQNGSVQVNFNGSTGINAGMAIFFGSRPGYPFGPYTSGIFDQDNLIANGLPPMGNLVLRNLRIKTNNPSTGTGPDEAILALGGLRNVVLENLVIDGQNLCAGGFYYEFGFASSNGVPGDQTKWTSSHAVNISIKNVVAQNLNTTVAGQGVGMGGAYSSVVEGLVVNQATNAFYYTPGEALFYRPWAPIDAACAKQGITLRNIVGVGITGTGIVMGGASSVSGGYLNGASPPLTPYQQVDLMTFNLDGFSISSAGFGVTSSGRCRIVNGILNGADGSGHVMITDDCTQFYIENVQAVNGTQFGFRLGFPSPIPTFATTPRLKIGEMHGCFAAGNTIGLAIANVRAFYAKNCRFGYSVLYDGFNETAQTQSVNIANTGTSTNCKFDSCFSTVATGGTSYVASAGQAGLGLDLVNPLGDISTVGFWDWNGVAQATAVIIATASSQLNVGNKRFLRQCWDTTNNRLMVAQGPNPTDPWIIAGFGASQTTVTPS